MSICDKNIITQQFTEEVILEQIKRDYGLTNVSNVNGGVVGCVEVFNGPKFISNLTKLGTGMTETSNGVFNRSNAEMTFDYTFTGNTDTLTAYTGNFQYQVYKRPPVSGFTNNPTTLSSSSIPIDTFENVLVHSTSTSFNRITSSGFTLTDEFANIVSDSEYVLNSNFSFIPNDCLYGRTIVSENLGNTYDEDFSLYFVVLSNPETPILGPFTIPEVPTPGTLTVIKQTIDGEGNFSPELEGTYVFDVPQTVDTSDTEPNCQLITESLTIDPIKPDTFVLEYKPYDDTLMVSVNGITLSTYDYTITDFVILTLSKVLSPTLDLITVTYLACDRSIDSIASEVYAVTGVTSGATSAYTSTEKVYYNTDYSKYEYYVDSEITDDENTIMYINGIKLTYGLDYYASTSVNNRLIFDSIVISVTDIIHIIYNVGTNVEGDYGVLGPGSNALSWKTPTPTITNERVNGEFLVEITESSDKDFTSTATTIQTIVNYVNNTLVYDSAIPTTLDAKKTYIWRVTNNKVYSGLLDNTYITTSISKIGKFFTNNTINSY